MMDMADRKAGTKCYTYVRVSTEMQVDGYSLDAQKSRLEKYADYQKLEIVREYCDAGKSGKSITGRPDFSRMLEDVASGRDNVDYILVFKLSRFGRNAADVLNSLQLIQDHGVNLICVEDGIDSSKESGKLTITVLSAVAEIERENILIQTMEGRKQKAREGKWNGGMTPFGYGLDKEKGILVVNQDEASVVRKIFDLYVHSGIGMEAIADYLNDHGYMKNQSREYEVGYFTQSFITKILDNPSYVGKIAYGRTKTEKVKGARDEYIRVRNDDYLLSEGQHEPIIDEETWNAAKRKRKDTGLPWVKTHSLDHEHILSGLIKCPVCGEGMCGMFNRYNSKKTGEYRDTFYYRCLGRKPIMNGKKCDFKHSFRQDMINAEVEELVLDMVRDKAFQSEILKRIEASVDTGTLMSEKEGLQNKLRQVEGSKNKLIDQMNRLDASDRHYERKFQDMQSRLDVLYDRMVELESSIDGVSQKLADVEGQKITSQRVCEILKDFNDMYAKMSDLDKKMFFSHIIRSIEVYPEKSPEGGYLKRIDFRFPVDIGGIADEKLLRNQSTVETVVVLVRK